MFIDFSNRFINIPSGNYVIGVDNNEVKRIHLLIPSDKKIKFDYIEASSPALVIYIESFYISKKLITVSEYDLFIRSTSYKTESEEEGWGWVWENGWKKKSGVCWNKPFGNFADKDYMQNAEILPVMQISWNDAVAYTDWLSSKEGISIRLPSEIEWEIFAMKTGIMSISDYKTSLKTDINDSVEFIKLLKSKIQISEFNTGLLWEWTSDWYEGYDKGKQNRDFGKIYKVLRGGSLLSEEIQKTREFRFRRCPTARSPFYGFRIAYN